MMTSEERKLMAGLTKNLREATGIDWDRSDQTCYDELLMEADKLLDRPTIKLNLVTLFDSSEVTHHLLTPEQWSNVPTDPVDVSLYIDNLVTTVFGSTLKFIQYVHLHNVEILNELCVPAND